MMFHVRDSGIRRGDQLHAGGTKGAKAIPHALSRLELRSLCAGQKAPPARIDGGRHPDPVSGDRFDDAGIEAAPEAGFSDPRTVLDRAHPRLGRERDPGGAVAVGGDVSVRVARGADHGPDARPLIDTTMVRPNLPPTLPVENRTSGPSGVRWTSARKPDAGRPGAISSTIAYGPDGPASLTARTMWLSL